MDFAESLSTGACRQERVHEIQHREKHDCQKAPFYQLFRFAVEEDEYKYEPGHHCESECGYQASDDNSPLPLVQPECFYYRYDAKGEKIYPHRIFPVG